MGLCRTCPDYCGIGILVRLCCDKASQRYEALEIFLESWTDICRIRRSIDVIDRTVVFTAMMLRWRPSERERVLPRGVQSAPT